MKQKQNDSKKVPAMPTMRWNKDATPDYSHLEEEPAAATTKKVKGGVEAYPMPKMQ